MIIRGLGPSLGAVGVQGALTDTTLELHQGPNTLATNDNWKINDQTGQSQEAEIRATTLPPNNDLESALIATLNPGAYTAILAGKGREVISVEPSASLADAVRLLASQRIGAALILGLNLDLARIKAVAVANVNHALAFLQAERLARRVQHALLRITMNHELRRQPGA